MKRGYDLNAKYHYYIKTHYTSPWNGQGFKMIQVSTDNRVNTNAFIEEIKELEAEDGVRYRCYEPMRSYAKTYDIKAH